MSNYHVLSQTKLQHEVRVVFHLTVPDQVNSASVNLRDCVKQDVAPTESQVPWLAATNATENAAILNGEIVEVAETIKFDANKAQVDKRNDIDSRYSVLAVGIGTKLANIYEWWGTDRDVP